MFDGHPTQPPLAFLLCASLVLMLTVPASVWSTDPLVQRYREPPRDIVELLTSPRAPDIAVSPVGDAFFLARRERFTPLAVLAGPVVRLGAVDVAPISSAPRRLRFDSLSLVDLRSYDTFAITLPSEIRADFPIWSPSGEHFAFSAFSKDKVRLWVGNVRDRRAHPVPNVALNASFGPTVRWMPDGRRLLCRLKVPRQVGSVDDVLFRPLIMDTAGLPANRKAGGTFGLASDQPRLAHRLGEVQLAMLDLSTGRLDPVGGPVGMRDAQPSPDGRFLLVSRISTFPVGSRRIELREETVEVWNLQGRKLVSLETELVALRSATDTTARVDLRRRMFSWLRTAAATLVYGEIEASAATPGGGERLMAMSAPFEAPPYEIFSSAHSITRVASVAGTDLVYLRDYDATRRQSNAYLIDARKPEHPARPLWTTQVDARGANPGDPIVRGDLLVQHENSIYLTGKVGEPDAARTYLDRMDLASLSRERIWTSERANGQRVVALLADDASRLLVSQETNDAALSYVVQDLADPGRYTVAEIRRQDPAGLGVHERFIEYKREDGLRLQATLYTPADRRDDERLPLILWGYPKTFRDLPSAQRAYEPRRRASAVRRAVPLFFAMRGYAVMDQVSLPIIEGRNGSFSEQLVESANAAVEQAVAIGVGDRSRVGIAGHSFGAFSAVSLLAHSDLFRAGVALSGAYNRTLTPFGFQTERRTFWEAPDHYLAMSPFLKADRIDEPLLLVHGERDDNAGTAPTQSRYLFEAMSRIGGTARLVLLPFEGHVYRARESVLHSAAEMLDWFDRHLKGGRDPTFAQTDPPNG